MIRFRSTPGRALATLAAGATIAAGVAGPAAAAPKPAFPLSFIGVYRNGVPIKVKKFQFSGVPVSCRQGPTTYGTSRPLPTMKVKAFEFGGTFRRKGTTIRVTGKYKRNLSAATGTLKVTGKVGSYTSCRSGKLRWKAA
ncbi:MAG: hypothetical protein R2691_08160 [Solirubrobacterales bacterium]